MPVPKPVCIGTSGYELFVERNHLREKILTSLKSGSKFDNCKVKDQTTKIVEPVDSLDAENVCGPTGKSGGGASELEPWLHT